jgi:heme oxygenase
MENINIMERLKVQTRKLHIMAHELPFFKALFKRELKIDSYVGQLRALAIIHEVLEREMASSDHPAVKSVLNGCMPKLPLLTRDIGYFDHLNIREISAANTIAMSLADKIIVRKQQKPVSLIGYLYTLEGSTLGGKVIKPFIADLFGLKGPDGLLFFDSYGEHVRSNWAEFSQRMLDAVQDDLTAKSIIEASHELFYGLFKIYESLHPLDTGDTP